MTVAARRRWGVGFWLGKSRRSDEHIIPAEGQIMRSRAIRHLPEDQSWSLERINAIRATPWDLRGEGEPGQTIAAEPTQPGSSNDHQPDVQVRGVRIEKADLERFGYTSHCKK